MPQRTYLDCRGSARRSAERVKRRGVARRMNAVRVGSVLPRFFDLRLSGERAVDSLVPALPIAIAATVSYAFARSVLGHPVPLIAVAVTISSLLRKGCAADPGTRNRGGDGHRHRAERADGDGRRAGHLADRTRADGHARRGPNPVVEQRLRDCGRGAVDAGDSAPGSISRFCDHLGVRTGRWSQKWEMVEMDGCRRFTIRSLAVPPRPSSP